MLRNNITRLVIFLVISVTTAYDFYNWCDDVETDLLYTYATSDASRSSDPGDEPMMAIVLILWFIWMWVLSPTN